MTSAQPVELSITAARLLAVDQYGDDVLLDESDDPLLLHFSKLSGIGEWLIEVDFGSAMAAIVTCNWQGGDSYVAHGEYLFWLDTTQRINRHSEIIPYVKGWLNRTLLRGIMRDDDILECPHLEISGRSS
jgi:hypothetical protein